MVTQRQTLDNPEAYNAADIAFHDALIDASGNHLLREVIGPISQVWRIGSVVTMRRDPGVVTYSMQGHEEIFAAMVAGDATAARDAMDRHLDRFEQRLASVLMTSTMPRSLVESELQDQLVTVVGEQQR
jgi:DNA-binding FadR family transcriptional regulator